jgi:hypothetical protein
MRQELYGLRYRITARILHHFNLHHTTRNYMDDGSILHWCHWCGMRRREVPIAETIREMQKALDDTSSTAE